MIRYLTKDDEVVCMSALAIFNTDTNKFELTGWADDNTFYFDGVEVEYEKDGRAYIHYE